MFLTFIMEPHFDRNYRINSSSLRSTQILTSAEGGQPRIVPTFHVILFDELDQFSFAQHRVLKVKQAELDLPGGGGR